MRKHKLVLLTILLGLLIVQSIEVLAMQRTAPLPEYDNQTVLKFSILYQNDVRFKNGIAGDQKTAGAETWTNYPDSSTYVSASFYWEDRVNDTMGSSVKSEGHAGQSSVLADSLANTNKKYYKVVSSHIATVSGNTISNPSVTTIVP